MNSTHEFVTATMYDQELTKQLSNQTARVTNSDKHHNYKILPARSGTAKPASCILFDAVECTPNITAQSVFAHLQTTSALARNVIGVNIT